MFGRRFWVLRPSSFPLWICGDYACCSNRPQALADYAHDLPPYRHRIHTVLCGACKSSGGLGLDRNFFKKHRRLQRLSQHCRRSAAGLVADTQSFHRRTAYRVSNTSVLLFSRLTWPADALTFRSRPDGDRPVPCDFLVPHCFVKINAKNLYQKFGTARCLSDGSHRFGARLAAIDA